MKVGALAGKIFAPPIGNMGDGGWWRPVAALFAAITFCSMVCNFACQLWYKEKKDKWRIVKN